MKSAYPDDTKRLQHIFEKQVYGLTPTEIIYQIALHFILGFDSNNESQSNHEPDCASIQKDAVSLESQIAQHQSDQEWH